MGAKYEEHDRVAREMGIDVGEDGVVRGKEDAAYATLWITIFAAAFVSGACLGAFGYYIISTL